MYKLVRITPIATRLNYIDNWGVVPHQPKRVLLFMDEETKKCFETNDIQLKLIRRKKKLQKLQNIYSRYIVSKMISTLLYVVNLKMISSISSHIKDMRRKFEKNKVTILAIYWQRDRGDKDFEPHLHVIFIVERISAKEFKNIFPIIPFPICGGKIKYACTLEKFLNYLDSKEIFAPKGKRGNSLSRKLLHPKNKL